MSCFILVDSQNFFNKLPKIGKITIFMVQTGKVGYMYLRLCVLFFAIFLMGQEGYGQKTKKDDWKKHVPTENIQPGYHADKPRNRPKRKVIEYIYVSDSKSILYGNPCAMEVTRRMGFEYVIQPLGVPGGLSLDDIEKHNILVKLKLFFTKGPFWKLVVKKRIKDCAKNSGDFVG